MAAWTAQEPLANPARTEWMPAFWPRAGGSFMKKRPMVGLMAAGLIAAMLPGSVSAKPPLYEVHGSCEDADFRGADNLPYPVHGQYFGYFELGEPVTMREFRAIWLEGKMTRCWPGSMTWTLTRIS